MPCRHVEPLQELEVLSSNRLRLSKRLYQNLARAKAARARLLRQATIVCCHTQSAVADLASLLQKRFTKYFKNSVEELAREIETQFLETQIEDLAQWLDWTGDGPQKEFREAKKLWVELELLRWVDNQNMVQGVVPLPHFVREECDRLSRAIGCESIRDIGEPLQTEAARKWVQRFGHRWTLQLGRQPVKEILSTELLREKAC